MRLTIFICFLTLTCETLFGAEVTSEIRDFHEKILVLDSHLDTPIRLAMPGFDITKRHKHPEDQSQVDLPRMIEGGLDGGFWAIYTRQGELTDKAYNTARQSALRTTKLIKKMISTNSEKFALALSANDAERITNDDRKIVYMSIENAYPLGMNLNLLDEFYELGVRMIGLVHSKNNQFADSSTDPTGVLWNGLSPLGRQLVRKANDLGLIIDASHAHDLALEEMIALSRTPILLSHSACKSVFNHPRNVDDRLLLKLKDNGGVIQINSLGSYLKEIIVADGRKKIYAKIALDRARGEQTNEPMLYEDFRDRYNGMDTKFPKEMARLEHYFSHFKHGLDLLGTEAVGVGADWDGGGGVTEMNDTSKIPQITKFLLEEGYSKQDIEKIWSGNLLRLLRRAELGKAKTFDSADDLKAANFKNLIKQRQSN